MHSDQVYIAMRAEILADHVMMHWFTIIVALAILAGTWIVENRSNVLAAFLPLLAVSWAAATLRFDFFIHRQAAYLNILEASLSSPTMSWDRWKAGLASTPLIVAPADVFAAAVIVIPTLYLLFGPCQQAFQLAGWKGGRVYAWVLTILILAALGMLGAVPRITGFKEVRAPACPEF